MRRRFNFIIQEMGKRHFFNGKIKLFFPKNKAPFPGLPLFFINEIDNAVGIFKKVGLPLWKMPPDDKK